MRLKGIKESTVIHCPTKSIVVNILESLNEDFYIPELWDKHKEETCIRTDGHKVRGFDCVDYYVAFGYEITEPSDIFELSAKEVLETMKEICKCRSMECYGCCLRGNCDPTEDSSENIIEICTKWRGEHPKEEKKELETEWVYVVRIIKVENNGFKKCVYEEDFPALIEKPVVEDVLKHYCSEHDGNFFATLEHICRIKE